MSEAAGQGLSGPQRRVRIPALLIAVNHIGVAERILAGTSRREAYAVAYELYYGLTVPAAKMAWWPGESLLTVSQMLHPDDLAGTFAALGDGRHWSFACFAKAAADAVPFLLSGDPDDCPVPAIVMPAAAADRLAWQTETMRRFSLGGGDGDLPACARAAIDQAAGRPRQRRAPVDETWLAAEVTEALDDAWHRLRAAARLAGGRQCEVLWQEPRHTAKTLKALLRDGDIWSLVRG